MGPTAQAPTGRRQQPFKGTNFDMAENNLVKDVDKSSALTKRKRVTVKEDEVLLLDRMDCINRAIANLKTDIPELVRKAVLDILKEREPRPRVEVGYR
jgi:ATP-dependent Lon protease